MGFSRQEYWQGLPFPFPGDLPDPGIKPASPLSLAVALRFFTISATYTPKGNQPCIFTGKTDAEAEAPILWPPDVKSQLIGKDSDVGKD